MARPTGKLKLSAFLMIMTIVGIAVFQGYWIRKLYVEKWNALKRETDVAFRDAIYNLQLQRFRKDTAIYKRAGAGNKFFFNMDSPRGFHTIRMEVWRGGPPAKADSDFPIPLPQPGKESMPMMMKYLAEKDSARPPFSVGEMDSAYKRELLRSNITVPYILERKTGDEARQLKPEGPGSLKTTWIQVSFTNAFAYQVSFGNPFGYIVSKLRLPIVVSILLLAFTTASFVFLYRNLVQQQQIAAIKNEFISNMTHELKTPIATVTVAVEALRYFGALEDPERTKEYLDISALELQRLSLLVDKVLKLSLFENKQIDLKPELVDLPALTAEVMASMKLSLEKAGAVVQLTSEGERLYVRADKMHLASVISNLLDNALKYSREDPVLSIRLAQEGKSVLLSVADNGIGIPSAYREKIFEKFFRVPSGDVHNIKGYGLGLSYVHHIVARHEGCITVESKEGKGSTFTIQLPAA